MSVDGQEPKIFGLEKVAKSSDLQFDSVQFVYVGRNETMAAGFSGCLSRIEFNELLPLKLLFQGSISRNSVSAEKF
jgi:hypothetical protein